MTRAEKWSSINVGIDEQWDGRALLRLAFRLLRFAPIDTPQNISVHVWWKINLRI